MGDSFTHLHVHTEFSMLDGAARLDELVAKAVADGQPALGITDHGNMALDVTIVEGLDASAAALRLKVPSTSLNELKIHQIRKILRDHPGDSPVYLHIGQGKILRLADEFCVDLDRAVGELRMLLGHDAVMSKRSRTISSPRCATA